MYSNIQRSNACWLFNDFFFHSNSRQHIPYLMTNPCETPFNEIFCVWHIFLILATEILVNEIRMVLVIKILRYFKQGRFE